MSHVVYESPVGPLTVREEDGAIVEIAFGARPGGVDTPLLAAARAQLHDYFHAGLATFDLPLRPAGTAYQRRVWDAMLRIPRGQVRTYGDLARMIDSGPRPIGMACGRNPIPVVIPCHRVVASNGLGGYSGGRGLPTKQALLELEGYLLAA